MRGIHSLSLLLFYFFFSCSLSDHGLEEEELDIVLPTKERVNKASMIIAHRGAWRETGLPENSLAAFQKALEMDIYGTECDVRQTKDGRLVVCHDAKHDGLIISKNNYATFSQHLLENGESLPLLDDFLSILSQDGGKVRLVLDLKACNITKLLNLIHSFGLLDRVDFVSNKQEYCDELVRCGLGYKTFFLAGSLPPAEVKEKEYGGIDYPLSAFQNHPEWISEALDLGLKVWAWTVNNEGTMKKYLKQGVVVTTDKPEMALNIEY